MIISSDIHASNEASETEMLPTRLASVAMSKPPKNAGKTIECLGGILSS